MAREHVFSTQGTQFSRLYAFIISISMFLKHCRVIWLLFDVTFWDSYYVVQFICCSTSSYIFFLIQNIFIIIFYFSDKAFLGGPLHKRSFNGSSHHEFFVLIMFNCLCIFNNLWKFQENLAWIFPGKRKIYLIVVVFSLNLYSFQFSPRFSIFKVMKS